MGICLRVDIMRVLREPMLQSNLELAIWGTVGTAIVAATAQMSNASQGR